MKRTLALILTLCALMPLMSLAEAASTDTAGLMPDVSEQLTFKAKHAQDKTFRMTDRDYKTAWVGEGKTGWLEIHSQVPLYGLYINFYLPPTAYVLEKKTADGWETVFEDDALRMAHRYVALDGETTLRLIGTVKGKKVNGVTEIFAFGQGQTLPDWVQRWEPRPEKADLLCIFAHPDDEVLFLGGTIPYYAAERKMTVVPAVMTYGEPRRINEFLSAMWHVGVRTYPVIGPFPDLYSLDIAKSYQQMGGKKRVQNWVTELYRRFKPDVVVTQDERGEYGHGMHKVISDAAGRAIKFANDKSYMPKSFEEYGLWQVKKLYKHLYKEGAIEMDWDQPLSAFGGKTGFEMAQEGYQFHLSQHRYKQYKVEPRDSRHSCYRFGLYFTDVGPDVNKNDFFENIGGSTHAAP